MSEMLPRAGGKITAVVHRTETFFNGSSTSLAEYTYTYDIVDRIKRELLNGTPTTYTYDSASQLVNDDTKEYVYDANGNRIMSGYVIGAGNRLLASPGATYTYDNEGNVTGKTDSTGTWAYSYDNQNQLAGATQTSATALLLTQATYSYDALGNMASKSVYTQSSGLTTLMKFAADVSGQTWADLTSGGSLTTRYVLGELLDSKYARVDAGGVSWLLSDRLGSVRNVTNGSGTLTATTTYDGFGNVTASSGTRGAYGFVGQRDMDEPGTTKSDGSGRVYDTVTGRWRQEDSIRFDGGDANLWRYVGNNPTNLVDPDGEQGTPPNKRQSSWPPAKTHYEGDQIVLDKVPPVTENPYKRKGQPAPTANAPVRVYSRRTLGPERANSVVTALVHRAFEQKIVHGEKDSYARGISLDGESVGFYWNFDDKTWDSREAHKGPSLERAHEVGALFYQNPETGELVFIQPMRYEEANDFKQAVEENTLLRNTFLFAKGAAGLLQAAGAVLASEATPWDIARNYWFLTRGLESIIDAKHEYETKERAASLIETLATQTAMSLGLSKAEAQQHARAIELTVSLAELTRLKKQWNTPLVPGHKIHVPVGIRLRPVLGGDGTVSAAWSVVWATKSTSKVQVALVNAGIIAKRGEVCGQLVYMTASPGGPKSGAGAGGAGQGSRDRKKPGQGMKFHDEASQADLKNKSRNRSSPLLTEFVGRRSSPSSHAFLGL